ncbi:MAG: OadG family protein [Clostridia bacterium]|nr:OadG family protein [Clostridia bacterium]
MDRLSLSLSTMGVGMLVVFCGLVILIACISVMTSITGRKKAPKAAAAAPAPKAAPAPAPVQAEPEPEADDGEIIAAITAAIAAVWQSEGKETGFVVRRVRRTQSSTARARAAREEQIFSHM